MESFGEWGGSHQGKARRWCVSKSQLTCTVVRRFHQGELLALFFKFLKRLFFKSMAKPLYTLSLLTEDSNSLHISTVLCWSGLSNMNVIVPAKELNEGMSRKFCWVSNWAFNFLQLFATFWIFTLLALENYTFYKLINPMASKQFWHSDTYLISLQTTKEMRRCEVLGGNGYLIHCEEEFMISTTLLAHSSNLFYKYNN